MCNDETPKCTVCNADITGLPETARVCKQCGSAYSAPSPAVSPSSMSRLEALKLLGIPRMCTSCGCMYDVSSENHNSFTCEACSRSRVLPNGTSDIHGIFEVLKHMIETANADKLALIGGMLHNVSCIYDRIANSNQPSNKS